MKLRSLAWLPVVLCAATGCAPSYVNLTPPRVPRSASNLYSFEVAWDSPRRGVNTPEVRGYVVIGQDSHPMTRVPDTEDRWEATVPAPLGRESLEYRYKFVYETPGVISKRPESSRSPEYRLTIAPNP